jgi:hypothetical protein
VSCAKAQLSLALLQCMISLFHLICRPFSSFQAHHHVTQHLSTEDCLQIRLITWLKVTLMGDVTNVEKTNRLVDSPAIIGDHDSAVTRRMMQMEEFKALGIHQPSGHKLMINPSHPLIIELHRVRFQHPGVAKIVAEQILDNAKISAGIVDHVQSMMPRLSAILKSALSDDSVPVRDSPDSQSPRAPTRSNAPSDPERPGFAPQH